MSCEWQYISSKNNALVVRLAKLKDKKYRKAEGLFRFDGIKLFCEAAANGAPVKYVLVSESAAEKYKNTVEEIVTGAQLVVLADEAFSKMTDESSPEGIITVCASLPGIVALDKGCEDVLSGDAEKSILMLESVRDTGNMGTIIRSARAFGIDRLVISSDCADLYNPKTVRAAMGALFTQNIYVVESISDAVGAIRKRGSKVYAAAIVKDAKRLGEAELKCGDAILIGNEGHGLSQSAIDACDECIYIPMEDGSESLNAGIAASVCMWEMYKVK